jgi:hypothetical protein
MTICSTPPSRSFGVAGDCERDYFNTGPSRFQQSFPKNFSRPRWRVLKLCAGGREFGEIVNNDGPKR